MIALLHTSALKIHSSCRFSHHSSKSLTITVMNYKIRSKINLKRLKECALWRRLRNGDGFEYVAYYGWDIKIDKNYKGTKAHFHISTFDEKRFSTGLMIESAEYCHHSKTDKLDEKTKKWLMQVLNHKAKGSDATNWEILLQTWNMYYPNLQMLLNLPIPDYTK